MRIISALICAILFSACVSHPQANEGETVREIPVKEFPLTLKLKFNGYDHKRTELMIYDHFTFTQFLESKITAESDDNEMIVTGKMLRPGFISVNANDPVLKRNWPATIYADGGDTIFLEYDKQKIREGRITDYPRVTSASAIQQDMNRFMQIHDSLFDIHMNEKDSLRQILLKAIQTDNKVVIDATSELLNTHSDKYRFTLIKTARTYAASRPPSPVTMLAMVSCHIPRNDPAFGFSIYKNLPDTLRASPYGEMLNTELIRYAPPDSVKIKR